MDKKQLYALDEIGFIGVQRKQTPAQRKKDMELTSKLIKAHKAGKPFVVNEKAARYAKAK